MKNSQEKPKQQKLWTRNFTLITVGSVISMLGNSLSGFAMSLLVLDYTGSTFYFALYMAVYMLPRIVMPVLSGPFLDRSSRRRAIYMLDFISSGLYALFAVVLHTGWFNFGIFLVACFLIGTLDSVYQVAYESFYPLLISEGNYSKAYSVSSTLETMTMVMLPVSAVVYRWVGIVPLFIFDAMTFLIAAVLETQIHIDETQIQKCGAEDENSGKAALSIGIHRFREDLREGMKYLLREKGLLAVAVYFAVSTFGSGADSAITLPYFKANFKEGVYVYFLVWGMAVLGRIIGGGVHYKIKLPAKAKFHIALTVYIVTSVLDGSYLYCPIPAMMAMCFANGILGITSYNIRISATQSYVPDDKKGRFNGIFDMLCTVGMLVGELVSGALATFLPNRIVLSVCMGIVLLAAVFVIGGHRKEVSAVYNTQV